MSKPATSASMLKPQMRLALAVAVLTSIVLQPALLRAGAGDDLADDQELAFFFHNPVPLGVDAVRLQPMKKTVYILASAENPSLDGVHIFRSPHKGRVVRVDGSAVKYYPDNLDFRVTATSIPSDFLGVEPYETETKQDINTFLLGMKFKLKVFRGLTMKELKPKNIKLIGVPAQQDFNERVYRVSFDTPEIPVDARLVLEVFDATGARLTRFHFEML